MQRIDTFDQERKTGIVKIGLKGWKAWRKTAKAKAATLKHKGVQKVVSGDPTLSKLWEKQGKAVDEFASSAKAGIQELGKTGKPKGGGAAQSPKMKRYLRTKAKLAKIEQAKRNAARKKMGRKALRIGAPVVGSGAVITGGVAMLQKKYGEAKATYKGSKGWWVTARGRKVFVKESQPKSRAGEEFFDMARITKSIIKSRPVWYKIPKGSKPGRKYKKPNWFQEKLWESGLYIPRPVKKWAPKIKKAMWETNKLAIPIGLGVGGIIGGHEAHRRKKSTVKGVAKGAAAYGAAGVIGSVPGLLLWHVIKSRRIHRSAAMREKYGEPTSEYKSGKGWWISAKGRKIFIKDYGHAADNAAFAKMKYDYPLANEQGLPKIAKKSAGGKLVRSGEEFYTEERGLKTAYQLWKKKKSAKTVSKNWAAARRKVRERVKLEAAMKAPQAAPVYAEKMTYVNRPAVKAHYARLAKARRRARKIKAIRIAKAPWRGAKKAYEEQLGWAQLGSTVAKDAWKKKQYGKSLLAGAGTGVIVLSPVIDAALIAGVVHSLKKSRRSKKMREKYGEPTSEYKGGKGWWITARGNRIFIKDVTPGRKSKNAKDKRARKN